MMRHVRERERHDEWMSCRVREQGRDARIGPSGLGAETGGEGTSQRRGAAAGNKGELLQLRQIASRAGCLSTSRLVTATTRKDRMA
jgi:hypothetical protein